jgi:phospholipid/cholesterol/gamma-HCH transport system substrate-binding protein
MHSAWSRARRARVGSLVIGSGALLTGLLVFVVGASFAKQYLTYYLLLEENVKGLIVGSAVNFQGVPVGAVRDIRFEEGKTRVELSFDPTRAAVQEGTRARLDRAFVTGQVTLELEGYRADGTALPEGSLIEPAPSPLTRLTAALPDVAQDLGALVDDARALVASLQALLDDEHCAKLWAVLDEVETMSATLAQRLPSALDEFELMAKDARAAAAALQRSADGLAALTGDGELRAAIQATRRAAEELAELERRAQPMLAELHGLAGAMRGPLLALLTAARDSAGQLQDLARRLSLAPSSLFFGGPARELVPGAAPHGSPSR